MAIALIMEITIIIIGIIERIIKGSNTVIRIEEDAREDILVIMHTIPITASTTRILIE
jgi:hypothetical protein